MSMSSLAAVAESVKGHLHGADTEFMAVSTDTRTLKSGELLFALKGEHFDAAEFVLEAARQGAAGAVVNHRVDADLSLIHI